MAVEDVDDNFITTTCYLVVVQNYDTCLHMGLYKTYEGALRRWNDVRLERLNAYIEHSDEDGYYEWHNHIYVCEAENPEEYYRRESEIDGSVDSIVIEEMELLD